MATKTINLTLDPEEYAYARRKKGTRTWWQVLLDGVEFKSYSKPVRKKRA